MISTATDKQQDNLCRVTFYFDFLSVFRLYSGIGSMVGMGDSTGCFVSWTYFCIDLWTGTSEV